MLAGKNFDLGICQLDSTMPAKAHQDGVLARMIVEGSLLSGPQLQFPDIIEIIGIDPVFATPGLGDQFIKVDILGKAFIGQKSGYLVYRPGDRDPGLAGFELALDLDQRDIRSIEPGGEDRSDIKSD